MAAESKSFPQIVSLPSVSVPMVSGARRWALWVQISMVYGLILLAAWTPDGPIKAAFMVLATCGIAVFALSSRYSAEQMGLGMPSWSGFVFIMGCGAVFALLMPLLAIVTGLRFPPIRIVPWHASWQYCVWALMQQFTLQSFFYLRMETLLGSRPAVLYAALLFSSIHLPSPILTIATLLGGIFFCEMFRRYRSILPLGLVHALLGLTIAASFSDHLLHHMRVGIGYLAFHA